jgi:hypothetical protein
MSRWQEKAHFAEAKKNEEPKDTTKEKEMVRETRERSTEVTRVAADAKSRQQRESTSAVQRAKETETPPTQEPSQLEQWQQSTLPEQTPAPFRQTRSGRTSKPPQRLIEVFDAKLTLHNEERSEVSDGCKNPLLIAFAASADPDTMYPQEALRQPDRQQFLRAMEKS